METLTPNYGLRKQDEDEFYSETINSDNMDIIDAELKKSAAHTADTDIHVTAEKQAGWDNLKTFQTAGGTATAIALTGIELTNGYQKTFVISANNSGAATTINGKPLYKPGGTVAPNLTAGKAATVWYNLSGDCFFIKASAEGTAVADDVLASKTFSNENDIGLVGTLSLTGSAVNTNVLATKTFYSTDAKTKITGSMVNRGAVTITPTASDITIADGYHNGAGYVRGDADLVSSNIIPGVNIFNINGNAPVKKYATGTVTSNSEAEVFNLFPSGTFTIYSITVSGLNFTPRVIIAKCTGITTSSNIIKYEQSADPIGRSGVIKTIDGETSSGGTGSIKNYMSTSGAAYVNSGGFKLPSQYASKTWEWEAFE